MGKPGSAIHFVWAAIALLACATRPGDDPAPLPDLIPRQTLFGDPARVAPGISPDGSMLSFAAPLDGVLNLWVAPVDAPSQARPITRDTKRGIWQYVWAHTNRHIVYLQDVAGDENWHAYAVDLSSGEIRDLTPIAGV